MNGNQTCRGFHDGPIVQIPKALHLEQVGIEKCRYFGLPDIKGARESGKWGDKPTGEAQPKVYFPYRFVHGGQKDAQEYL